MAAETTAATIVNRMKLSSYHAIADEGCRSWLERFAPDLVIDRSENIIFWSILGDAILITGLFVLGGELWDKLKALLIYDARVLFPEDATGG